MAMAYYGDRSEKLDSAGVLPGPARTDENARNYTCMPGAAPKRIGLKAQARAWSVGRTAPFGPQGL